MHYYYWTDLGIVQNNSHPFWIDQKQEKVKLDGAYIEECMWTPKFRYVGVGKISSWMPSPTQPTGPPYEIYLTRAGIIEMVAYTFHLTLSCLMDFTYYPFDSQVKLSL